MRTLINYIRQCFCKHELEFEYTSVRQYDYSLGFYNRTKTSQTCKKCGYHKSYYEF